MDKRRVSIAALWYFLIIHTVAKESLVEQSCIFQIQKTDFKSKQSLLKDCKVCKEITAGIPTGFSLTLKHHGFSENMSNIGCPKDPNFLGQFLMEEFGKMSRMQ